MTTTHGREPSSESMSGGRKALVVSIMIPIVAVLTVAVAAGAFLPQISAETGRESRAAVAIRDDVTPFQKWGTRAFTFGQLTASYEHVEYITQASGDPKHAEFVAALETTLENFEVVDLFLLAHTNSYIDWVSEIDPGLRRRIRFVYNTGCGGTDQAGSWLARGADVYVGHPGESESPVFYAYFLRRWLRGSSIREAVEESNENTYTFFLLGRWLLYGNRSLEDLWKATRAEISGAGDVAIAAGASR